MKGDPWSGAYVYGYRSFQADCPESMRGEYFLIAARLEDTQDPVLGRKPRDCHGGQISWLSSVFAFSSLDLADIDP